MRRQHQILVEDLMTTAVIAVRAGDPLDLARQRIGADRHAHDNLMFDGHGGDARLLSRRLDSGKAKQRGHEGEQAREVHYAGTMMPVASQPSVERAMN